MRCARPAALHGFTLIEALVAIALLALVALLAWRATAAMADSEMRLTGESARWQRLDSLLTRIEADLREAVPRRARHGTTVEPAWSITPDDAAGNTVLVFTRAGSDAPDEPGTGGQRVGYRWRDGRIEVLYWPHIDNPATASPSAYSLVDGITGFRITALDSDHRWSPQWPELRNDDLPRGIRLEVALADGGVIERWFALQ